MDFRYNYIIYLKNNWFCCIESEIGVLGKIVFYASVKKANIRVDSVSRLDQHISGYEDSFIACKQD